MVEFGSISKHVIFIRGAGSRPKAPVAERGNRRDWFLGVRGIRTTSGAPRIIRQEMLTSSFRALSDRLFYGIKEYRQINHFIEESIKMSFVFNADEIFAMAEQIEKNGAQFYRTASAQVEDAAAKDLLLKLAAMEDEHLRTFAAMKGSLPDEDKKAMTFDPNNEAGLYLASLANTKVFFGKDIDTSDLQGIFKAALAAEKDSILFYLGMKDLVPENLGRSEIEEIIQEEMRHIRILGEKLSSL
jgi:rubrerythrin